MIVSTEGVLVLKGQIFNNIHLGRCGCLEKADLDIFTLGGCGSLERSDVNIVSSLGGFGGPVRTFFPIFILG